MSKTLRHGRSPAEPAARPSGGLDDV